MNKKYRVSNGLNLPNIQLANLSPKVIEKDAKMFSIKFKKALKELSKY